MYKNIKQPKMKKLLLLLSIVLASFTVSAQSYLLQGVVVGSPPVNMATVDSIKLVSGELVHYRGGVAVPVYGTGQTYTAGNGLTLSGTEFELGVSLTDDVLFFGNNTHAFELTYMEMARMLTQGGRGILLEHLNTGNDISSISISNNGMIVKDEIATKGFEYFDDYSSTWTDHSLVTKKWVTDNFNTPLYTASNGLDLTGNDFSLGGSLTGTTVIFGAATHEFSIYYMEMARILTQEGRGIWLEHLNTANDISSLKINNTGMVVADAINNKGLEYSVDYSPSWTDHSLVTKKWVTDNFSSGGGAYTASNGITLTGPDFTLGGSLTGGTVLFGAATHSFEMTYMEFGRILTQGGRGILFEHLNAGSDIASITMNDAGMTIADAINSKGFEYGADYSSAWTDHSLVTKKWVTDNFAGGATPDDTIALETLVVLKTDWHSFPFGLGNGNAGDDVLFVVGAEAGSWKESRDTIVPQELHMFAEGASGNCNVQLYYGSDPTTSGTAILTSTLSVTTGTPATTTAFDETEIPPGNIIWAEIAAVGGTEPTKLRAYFSFTFQ